MAGGLRWGALAGAVIAMLLAGDASAANKKPAPLRCDKLTGKGHRLWDYTADPGDPSDKAALDAYFFDARGRAVTAQGQSHGPGSSSEQIYAYAPDGTGLQLDEGTQDEIPGASLAYDGRVITWTHSGEARTAAFVGR